MSVKNYQQQESKATLLICNGNGDQWNFAKCKNQAVLNATVIGSDVVRLKTDKGIMLVEYIWID